MRFESPVIIIGCPRSGTTLLYRILSGTSGLSAIGYESRDIIERWHHPRTKGWDSGALAADDLTEESRDGILQMFTDQIASGDYWFRVYKFRRIFRDAITTVSRRFGETSGTFRSSVIGGVLPPASLRLFRALVRTRNRFGRNPRNAAVRLVEKTPENCLRIPFLLRLFPDGERAREAFEKELSRRHMIGSGGYQPFLCEDPPVVAVPYPNDPELPELRRIYQPERFRRTLSAVLPGYPGEDWRIQRQLIKPTLLAYKPGRRAVYKLKIKLRRRVGDEKIRVRLHAKFETAKTAQRCTAVAVMPPSNK